MRAFNENTFTEFTDKRSAQIKTEICSQSKEYILNVDEQQYLEYLKDKYWVEPLAVDFDTEKIHQPQKQLEKRESRRGDDYYEIEVYHCTVSYPFTGMPVIFRLKSNPWNWTSYEITVDERSMTVSFAFTLDRQDPELFRKNLLEARRAAFLNLDNANTNANTWNAGLPSLAENLFKTEKAAILEENAFFAAINLKVSGPAESSFSVPIIRKKLIPQPVVSKQQGVSNYPTVSDQQYEDLLKLLYDLGQGMERKPSLYKGKDENGIRDFFLSHLELRYEGVTATGETFNNIGRTDICLKYAPDGSNLFIAECKFWTGHKDFLATISQLLGYLTWRDSKVAVMMFVRNNDMSAVLNNIRVEVRNHSEYLRNVGQHGDSSLSYFFCLPQDRGKEIRLEVMAFHFHHK